MAQWILLVVALVWGSMGEVKSQQNLMQNPGFESQLAGHWEANGFTMTVSDDAHSGSKSGKFTNRRGFYQGPAQLINIMPGKLYYYSSYVKQLNDMPGHMFQRYRVNIGFTFQDTGSYEQLYIVHHTIARSADGWFRVAGYFRAPTRTFTAALLHYQAPDTGIDFLLDDTSLTEVAEAADWKQTANQRIQQHRTSDINFSFTLGEGLEGDEVEIFVDHKKHSFGFGTLVRDEWMTDAAHRRYQDTLYKYFNVGTTQGVKWRFDRGTQGHPDYTTAVAAIDAMRQHGLSVRGHNMFWGYDNHVPDYVKPMTGSQLNSTVMDHLQYMVSITKGKLDHWDVVNELLHGQMFEQETGDPSYSEHLYNEVHRLDPKPKLLLNDYGIIADRPEMADVYLQQVQGYQARNVSMHGVGIQSHFHHLKPDPELMRLQVDTLAQAGLPIWVTEMDVWQRNETLRAQYFEDALRFYFSHPAIEGIVLWGFWTQAIVSPLQGALFDAHLQPNAAGNVWINLTQKEWSTHYNTTLANGNQVNIQGFRGDYEVTIKVHGNTVKVVPFSTTSDHTSINVDVPAHA